MNERAVDRLRKKKVTPTLQRVAILEHIQERTDHPTAEEIYQDLRVNLPSLSRATVYNTLELLRKLGEIQRLSITINKAHYDPNTKPHHHFLCRRCERVIDIDIPYPIIEGDWVQGNRIEAVQVCLQGICSNCLKKEEENKKI